MVTVYRKVSFVLNKADEGKYLMLSYPRACLSIQLLYIKDLVELHNIKPIGGGTGSKNPILIVCRLLFCVVYFIIFVVPKC